MPSSTCAFTWLYCAISHGLCADTHSVRSSIPTIGFNTKRVQKGHVTLKWLVVSEFTLR